MSKRIRKKDATNTPRGAQNPVRLDSVPDDGRPFADVRKSLQSVLGIITLHRWAFFLPACVAASAAFWISLHYPRMYSATTTFERRHDPIMFDLPLSAGAASSFALFRSTMHTDLTSAATMVEVVDNLGLTKQFDRNEDQSFTPESVQRRNSLARALGSRISVNRSSPNEQLDIIHITYTGPDPNIGKRMVEEVRKVYIRRTMVWMHQFLERQRDYFQAEQGVALQELNQAQREETKIRLDHPYVNPGDPGSLTAKLGQLELERRELLMRRREYEAELLAGRQMLVALEPSLDPFSGNSSTESIAQLGPEALRLQAKRVELEKELQNLRTTRGMTDEHPEIRSRKDEIVRLESAIDSERHRLVESANTMGEANPPPPTRIPPAADMAFLSERGRLRALIDAQEVKITDLDVSLDTNEVATAQMLSAKEHLFEHQEEFNAILNKVAQAKQKVSQVEATLMSIEPAINAVSQDRLMQFSEGQAARSSSLPISPKAQTVVLLAGLAAALAGIVGVILAEILDHVFHSSGNVARSLGLPILEAIDEIVTAKDRRRLMVRRAVWTPIIVLAVVLTTGVSGSLAYFSLQRPWTYQQIQRIPQTALHWFGMGSPKALAGTPVP